MVNNSLYHDLNREYVIVTTRTTSFLGRMTEDTHDTLRLRPSLVHEPRISILNGALTTIPRYRLEEEKDTIVNTIEVQAIQPTTRKHLNEILNLNKKEQDEK